MFCFVSDRLKVRVNVVTITADEVWGVVRALQTLYQLLILVFLHNVPVLLLRHQTIHDAPVYPHRGMLVDTARHYLPISTIKTMLDAMAANKLNVMHWHIVDDESFPLKLKKFPELARAAHSPEMIYNEEDVMDIVKYARLRGIRVMPELDTPGTHCSDITGCNQKVIYNLYRIINCLATHKHNKLIIYI